MVRMSKASRKRVVDQHYKQHNKLLNRHFLNILVIAVIALAVAFYFYLLGIEKANYAEEQQEAARKKKNPSQEVKFETIEHLVTDPHKLRHAEERRAVDENSNNMVPSQILPASRVLSAGLPFILYGTAWKKHETARLVAEAVHSGFRFIDTACQPKHYNERGVGEGWTTAAEELGLQRTDIFLQTKFTSISGQDPSNIPYDHTASLEAQVAESLQVSLGNLQTSYLDSWVMHSPMPSMEDTMTVYRVMEQAVDDGKALRIGISNCYDYNEFTTIYEKARIKPAVLQNRFYGDSDWDQELRKFCKHKSIWYQSFWTLTANRDALATERAHEWASSKQLTPQTLMYAYMMSLGYGTPLDGTTNREHMEEDIAVMERLQKGEAIFENDQEIRRFEQLLGF